MKFSLVLLLFVFPFVMGSSYDQETAPNSLNTQQNNPDENNDAMSTKIRIKIGDNTFGATLSDNATATAFKALLPMTIKMIELNGNEKYFELASNLPTNASRPTVIQTGDLMLYGSRTLVLFYETFSTTYSYTKLGHIDDPEGLAAALGARNVTVTFEMY